VARGNDMNQKGLEWSGRGDLNARPPAPKTDAKELQKQLIFNYLRFKALVPAC
jgi:hypothetical protein